MVAFPSKTDQPTCTFLLADYPLRVTGFARFRPRILSHKPCPIGFEKDQRGMWAIPFLKRWLRPKKIKMNVFRKGRGFKSLSIWKYNQGTFVNRSFLSLLLKIDTLRAAFVLVSHPFACGNVLVQSL